MKGKYSRFFALITQANAGGASLTKEQLVKDFTNGKTESLSDLQEYEFQELERNLQKLVPAKKAIPIAYVNDAANQTRRAIIAQFRSIGRTPANAIEWAEKYGVKGNKRKFNEYTGQELYVLLQNAKKVKGDFIKSINKKL